MRWDPACPVEPKEVWAGSEQAPQREEMKSQTENKGKRCLLKKWNRLWKVKTFSQACWYSLYGSIPYHPEPKVRILNNSFLNINIQVRISRNMRTRSRKMKGLDKQTK